MLAPGKHYVNAPITLAVHLEDEAGNDYDPTTVTLKTLDPFGAMLSYVYGTDNEIGRVDSGNYTGDITPDSAGRWRYRWETTGGVVVEEGDFLVQDSGFYPWADALDYAP